MSGAPGPEASTLGPSLAGSDARPKSFAETVRDYLEQELLNHPEEERAALLERAEELMKEME